MRTRLRFLSILIAGGALAACTDRAPLGPEPEFGVSGRGATQITVMSRNLYIGADVDPVLQAILGGGDVQAALLAALAQLQRTDFSSRVWALADEIVRARPDVVGLQEVYTLTLAPPFVSEEVTVNFLAALQYALAMRGAPYQVAVQSDLTDFQLPGVHLVDHDVLLVNPSRVAITGPVTAVPFVANFSPVVRGYVTAQAEIDGIPLLLVNSHLESGSDPQLVLLRAAQAMELMEAVGTAPKVVLMGDLNDVPGSPMHQVVAGAGMSDLWGTMRPAVAGYSCCHAADLSNTLPTLDERIDYVWTRGLHGPSGKPQGQINLTGNTPSALLAGAYGSIWPSDHAGVVAKILLPASLSRN